MARDAVSRAETMQSSQFFLPIAVRIAISFLGPFQGQIDAWVTRGNAAGNLQKTPTCAKSSRRFSNRLGKREEKLMGEISDLMQQKVGLSPDQAQQVEQVDVEYVKSKVPAEFQGMLGSVLGEGSGDGQPAASGGLGSLLGAASSLFGNKG